jgi:hypothetical protein
MSGLCLALGAAIAVLGADMAELRWTHSVQKTEWRETWRATPAGLQLELAAVQGSGAGMEPGDGATLENGFWIWRPQRPAQPELILTRSGYTGSDWQICIKGNCRAVGSYFPGSAPDQNMILKPCP